MGIVNVDVAKEMAIFNEFTKTLSKLDIWLIPRDKRLTDARLYQFVNDIGIFVDKWGKK